MTREFYNKYKEYVKDITQEDINESFVINFMKDLYNFDLKPYLSGKVKLTAKGLASTMGHKEMSLSRIFEGWQTGFDKNSKSTDIVAEFNKIELYIPRDFVKLMRGQIIFLESKPSLDLTTVNTYVAAQCKLLLKDKPDNLYYQKTSAATKHFIYPEIRLKDLLEMYPELITENLLIYSDE